jgi:putative transposase
LQLGTIPVEVRVPRTRTGDFRPATLPAPYQRGYPEETQALLLGLLASARSLNVAEDALQKLGLSGSEQELERVATGLVEELELRNSRPIDPDLLALFLDGKYVEFRDRDRLRSACIYVVLGLRREGRKQVLDLLAPALAKEANLRLSPAQSRYQLGLRSIVELSQAQLQQADAGSVT